MDIKKEKHDHILDKNLPLIEGHLEKITKSFFNDVGVTAESLPEPRRATRRSDSKEQQSTAYFSANTIGNLIDENLGKRRARKNGKNDELPTKRRQKPLNPKPVKKRKADPKIDENKKQNIIVEEIPPLIKSDGAADKDDELGDLFNDTIIPEQQSHRETTKISIKLPAPKKKISSLSFMKRNSSIKWTDDETKKFYKALKYYGLDFSMMASWFSTQDPKRNRQQLKSKYHREEKDNPKKVDEALRKKISKVPENIKNELDGIMGCISTGKKMEKKKKNILNSNDFLAATKIGSKEQVDDDIIEFTLRKIVSEQKYREAKDDLDELE